MSAPSFADPHDKEAARHDRPAPALDLLDVPAEAADAESEFTVEWQLAPA